MLLNTNSVEIHNNLLEGRWKGGLHWIAVNHPMCVFINKPLTIGS